MQNLIAPLLVVLVLGIASEPLAAQSVRGQVNFRTNGVGVPSAFVSLLDEAGARVLSGLTNREGRYLLYPPVGTYSVRVEMVGLATAVEGPVVIGLGETVDVSFILSAQAIPIVGLDVDVEERGCDSNPENVETVFRIWDEVQKALRVVEWGQEGASLRHSSDVRVTDLSPDLTFIEAEEVRTLGGMGTQPFRAAHTTFLADSGFVREASDGYQFFAPDAEYLLSPEFVETHCILWGGVEPETGEVRLNFRPRQGRELPDISGVIALDQNTYGLLDISFEYENVDFNVRSAGASGEVSFLQLESGEWLVDEWWIRTPREGRRSGRQMSRRKRYVLVGYREAGGRLFDLWSGTDPAPKTRPMGTVQGRIVDGRTGVALSGAFVYLSGTRHSTMTNRFGLYVLPNVSAGDYRIAIKHPELDKFRAFTPIKTIRVEDGDLLELALTSPTWDELRARFCEGVTTHSNSGMGFVLGLIENVPLDADRPAVHAEWDYGEDAYRDSRTPFLPGSTVAICGLPSNVGVAFTYESGRQSVPLDSIFAQGNTLMRWKIPPPR